MKEKFRKIMLVIVMITMLMHSNGFLVEASQWQEDTKEVNVNNSETVQKAANSKPKKVAKIIVTYNKKAKVRNGQKVTSNFSKKTLRLQAYGVNDKGKKLNIPVTVKEQGKFLYAKNNKLYITLVCGEKTKKLRLSNVIPVKKVTVKKGSVKLIKNKKLTNAMLKKLSFQVTWKDGKKEKNYKGAKCLDVGKKIKGKTFKVKFQIGNKIVTVKLPVKQENKPTTEPTEHKHSWKSWVSTGEDKHERVCRYCKEKEIKSHNFFEWKYVESSTEIQYCKDCNYVGIRAHRHEINKEEMEYTYEKTNKDGIHKLIGTYICKTCKKKVTEKKDESCSYSKWQYVGDNTEVRHCVHCAAEQKQKHQHEKEPDNLNYTVKTNGDGTHKMQASYTCNACKETINVYKIENCLYENSYKQADSKDIHVIVKTCRICQYHEEKEGTCEPSGALKCVREEDGNIYEYYDCKFCNDRCGSKLHTTHVFEDWEYRDSRTHMAYCACVDERVEETHNYVWEGDNILTCEGCHDSKVVSKHDHNKGTERNMDLIELIYSPAYNELFNTQQIPNPITNPKEYCSLYGFMCRTCNLTYCVYYDHDFDDNGKCTRKGYCGGVQQQTIMKFYAIY